MNDCSKNRPVSFSSPKTHSLQPPWHSVFQELFHVCRGSWASCLTSWVVLITQRLSVNFWPLFFSCTQPPTPLSPLCVREITQRRSKSKHGIGSTWKQICRFSQAETNRPFYFTTSANPWPFLSATQKHTGGGILTISVDHDECADLESESANLFRRHKRGVSSISMVIKPDRKACRHSCVFLCVCNIFNTYTSEQGFSFFLFVHWAG